MSVKRGLGRGFESLIPTEVIDESFDPTAEQDERMSELRHISLSLIEPDADQPRTVFDADAIRELATSIEEHGLLQPIVVVPHGSGTFSIVAGERRYRAAKLAGLKTIPALVRTLSAQHKLELSLIENLQRSDLTAIETATAYLKLRDQFNLSLEEIGHRVGGKSVAAVSNTMRLLRLPQPVRQAILDGKMTEGRARPLIGLDDAIIDEVLPRILAEEWSARTIEQYVARLKRIQTHAPKSSTPNRYNAQTEQLAKRFATDVSVRAGAKGTGKIIIPFKNSADFERITKLLQ
ncbi:MAG: ParB/RepB/Spo0J family partition protein [Candidatus Saccharimonas sp.]